MESRNVSVYWDPQVLRALDARAKKENVSRSKLINRICKESPEVRDFVSSGVVGGFSLAAMGLLYVVAWAVTLPVPTL